MTLTSAGERYRLIHTRVTLNGDPAKISGALNRYATVTNHRGLSAEWSWEAVAHIVDNKGGKFLS